jgi:hypothetical protein
MICETEGGEQEDGLRGGEGRLERLIESSVNTLLKSRGSEVYLSFRLGFSFSERK